MNVLDAQQNYTVRNVVSKPTAANSVIDVLAFADADS